MRTALVANNTVMNVIQLEEGSTYLPPNGEAIFASDVARIGWTYDGTTFTAPPEPAPTSPPNPNEAILVQIAALEAQQTDRRVREAVLGMDGGWLAALNQQVAALRAQLEGHRP